MFQIFFYSHTLDQADRPSLAESLIINCTFCFRAFCFFAAAWLLCRLVCGKGTHATLAGGTRTYAAIGIPFPRRGLPDLTGFLVLLLVGYGLFRWLYFKPFEIDDRPRAGLRLRAVDFL